jgi:homoserine dehydrogenase
MLHIGLFGFGVVGQGLWDVLHRTHGLSSQIKRICVKDHAKSRPLPMDMFTFNHSDILDDPDLDIVVELIDDADAAFELVTTALRNGKSVVTANKKMVAEHFTELLELQRVSGKPLLYEASTGGSIPILRNLEEYYDNDLLSGVEGIVNGTTNYILTRLATDASKGYGDALAEAQRLGFAESEPFLDVSGWDAAYKTLIIAAHSMGRVLSPTDVVRRGIDTITSFDVAAATSLGRTIKLLSQVRIHDNGFFACALPCLLQSTDTMAAISNETNAIRLHGAFADDQMLVGKGAGAHPTASAVLSDLAALRYAYKYEYKKISQGDAPNLSLDVSIKVYVRGASETIGSVPFTEIDVEHRTREGRYVIGNVVLDELVHSDAFTSNECFVAIAD